MYANNSIRHRLYFVTSNFSMASGHPILRMCPWYRQPRVGDDKDPPPHFLYEMREVRFWERPNFLYELKGGLIKIPFVNDEGMIDDWLKCVDVMRECWDNSTAWFQETLIFELWWLYRLYLLSGQAWNFSGLGIILIIKYRVQTVDPMSFVFSESDEPSGQFCIFSTLPVIGWRLKVQFRPTGKLVSGGFSRGCRVANRLQGFQAEASPFLKAGLETCYWWFKGQPIDMHHASYP